MTIKPSRQFTLIFVSVLLVLGLIVGGYYLIRNRTQEKGAIIVPQLPPDAKRGEVAFGNFCIECHGQNAAGADKGPPLVHRIYTPSHHSNVSFVRAVTLGARQHHWLFGNMAPLPQVERKEIDLIIIYIRELQKANGIG